MSPRPSPAAQPLAGPGPGAVAALLLGALLLAYGSVLITPYAFSDDYYQLAAHLRDPPPPAAEIASLQALSDVHVAMGRPLQVRAVSLLSLARGIGDLRWLRLYGVVCLVATLTLLHHAARRAGLDSPVSLALCVLLGVSPPAQVIVSGTVWAITLPATLASAVAFTFAERSWRALVEGRLRPARWLGLSAAGVLALGFATHQAYAAYFWAPAAATLLPRRATPGSRNRELAWYLGIFGLAGVAALLPLAWGLARHGASVVSPDRAGLASDVLGKAGWFLAYPLADCLNLGRLAPSGALAAVTGLAVGLGLLLRPEGPARHRFRSLGLALLLLPLSYLPNLLTRENWSAYRTQLGLQGVVLVMAAVGVVELSRRAASARARSARDVALAGLVAVGVWQAAHNTRTYFALPQMEELGLARRRIAAGAAAAREIWVVPSTWRDSRSGLIRYDEIGIPSTSQPWVPKPLAYLVLRELGLTGRPIPIRVVASADDSPPGVLVVDFRELGRSARASP